MILSKYQDKKSISKLPKSEWELYKFEDILSDNTRQATKIKKKDYCDEGDFPIIDQGKSHVSGYTSSYEGLYENSPCIIFGDHTRAIKFVDFPLFIGADGVKLLKNKKSEEEVLTKFLYYYLSSVRLPDTGYNRHFKYLKEIIFPIPNISIQNEVVAILDKSRELINKRKFQIEALDQLTQSVFLEMFGDLKNNKFNWRISELGDVCPFIKDGPHVSPKYTDKGVPFISVNNIIKDKWDFSNVKYISESDYETFAKRCKPEKGDILYTKGGTTGFAKYIDIDTKFINWVHLAVLKYDKSILNGIFLTHMLNSQSCYVQSQRYTRGIANRDLVLGQMKKIKVLIPPLEEQEKFENIIKKINEQKVRFESSLLNIEKNYNSIMQRAFKGDLFTQEKLPNA